MNNNIETKLQNLLNNFVSVNVTHEDIYSALKEIQRLQKIVLIRRKYLECDC